ncbi:polyphosphate polymerase domain-containing protein [Streptomyces sp. NPDC093591]|uniref:polyphosphate polymerase domain-containing protein n=1 Tax=Streptomyces sp. NPDC093591 TaxID=3366044 RepID=UPI0037FEF05C
MTAADPLTRVTGALRPIGLDELVARASLLTRLDRKYMLPVRELPLFLAGLGDDAQILEMAGQRRFGYRSVYFDTPGLDGYLGAARRRRRRFKLRVRTYLDSGDSYFEVKTRGPRGATVKERMPYEGEAWRLDPAARAYADEVLAGAGINSDSFRFVPSLVTSYRRTTLFLPASDSRVTVDTDLTWALLDGTELRTPDRAVVETKSGRAGSGADRLLWSLKHRPCPVSKYGTGLAALRPELPAHRWLPVLRRHFPSPLALTGSPA